MYYTTYRRLVTAVLVVTWILFSATAFLVLGSVGGILLLLLIGAIYLGVALLAFRLVSDRLGQYGGRIPLPIGGLGLWGADLVDDRDPVAVAGYQQAIRELSQPDFDSNELDPPGTLHCPFCHAALARPDSRFCDACGKPISVSGAPGAVPRAAQ